MHLLLKGLRGRGTKWNFRVSSVAVLATARMIGDIERQYYDAKQHQQMKERLRKLGIHLQFGERVIPAAQQCTIVDLRQSVQLHTMLNFCKAAHGLTPIMIGPAVMAAEGLRLGDWNPKGSRLSFTTFGKLMDFFCIERGYAEFDAMVAAVVLRFSASNVPKNYGEGTR